jgi:hypothetical protein
MKKLLSALIALIMVVCLVPLGAFADNSALYTAIDDIRYESLTKTVAVDTGGEFIYLGIQPVFDPGIETTPTNITGFSTASVNSAKIGAGTLEFDPVTATVTATNIEVAQIISYWGSFTINFEGTNTIDNGTTTYALATNYTDNVFGSTGYVDGDSSKGVIYNTLIIGGSGRVTIKGGNYTLMSKFGDLVFRDSVTVEVQAQGEAGSNAVHVSTVDYTTDSDLYILDKANLYITKSEQYGIRMGGAGMLYIDTEGIVDINFDIAAKNWGYGIMLYRGCDFVFKSGTINIDITTETQALGGLYFSGDVYISGGVLNVDVGTNYAGAGRANGMLLKDEANCGEFEVTLGGNSEVNINLANAFDSTGAASGVFFLQSTDQSQGITLNIDEGAVINVDVTKEGTTPGAFVNQKTGAKINLRGGTLKLNNVNYLVYDTSTTATVTVTGTKIEANTITGLFDVMNMTFEYPQTSGFVAMLYGETKEGAKAYTDIDVFDTYGLTYFRTVFSDDPDASTIVPEETTAPVDTTAPPTETTTPPHDTTPPPEETTTEPPATTPPVETTGSKDKGGCKSALPGAAVAAVIIIATSALGVRRKKEN